MDESSFSAGSKDRFPAWHSSMVWSSSYGLGSILAGPCSSWCEVGLGAGCWHFVGGGRDRFSGDDIVEEYIPNPNGGKRGGSYVSLTFEAPDGSRVRINTVDPYAVNTRNKMTQ